MHFGSVNLIRSCWARMAATAGAAVTLDAVKMADADTMVPMRRGIVVVAMVDPVDAVAMLVSRPTVAMPVSVVSFNSI